MRKNTQKSDKMNGAVRLTILFIIAVSLITFWTVEIVIKARQSTDEYPTYTYDYATRNGEHITGVSGYTQDDILYVIDESAFFGPYSEKPSMQISIANTDFVIDTDTMGFSNDMIEGIGHGVYDCRKEQRIVLDDDSRIEAGLARFEDGEIYIYVNFLQKVENLGGSSNVTKIWSIDQRDKLTDEERELVDAVFEIEDRGRREYRLYAPSDMDDIKTGYVTALEYHVDSLQLVGYCPGHPLLYDRE